MFGSVEVHALLVGLVMDDHNALYLQVITKPYRCSYTHAPAVGHPIVCVMCLVRHFMIRYFVI